MSGVGIAKNRGGRPPERDEAKRAAISMRITPATRAALDDAANRAGRSLAQEVEQRLERSIEVEAANGGPATAALVQSIVADIAEIEALTGKSWATDHETYGAVCRAVVAAVYDRSPLHAENDAEVRKAYVDALAAQKALEVLYDLENGGWRILASGGGLRGDWTPEPVDGDQILDNIRSQIPAAEEKAKAAYDLAERLYAPTRAAELRGRRLYADIRKRRREAREIRRVR